MSSFFPKPVRTFFRALFGLKTNKSSKSKLAPAIGSMELDEEIRSVKNFGRDKEDFKELDERISQRVEEEDDE